MSERTIVTPSNLILRKKARKVTSFTPELQNLIDDMIDTMHAAPGSGLAAPQVGQSLRLFTVHIEEDPHVAEYPDLPPAPGIGRVHVMVNPEISRASDKVVVGTEACLSISGYAGNVERHWEITIKYLDRHRQKRKLKTFGWLARVLQHEYDHLDGVLFIDRALDVWKIAPQDAKLESR